VKTTNPVVLFTSFLLLLN